MKKIKTLLVFLAGILAGTAAYHTAKKIENKEEDWQDPWNKSTKPVEENTILDSDKEG